MGAETGIEWTTATWNPWQGCRKVSLGCKFCYMYRDKERYGQDPRTVVRSSSATFRGPLSTTKYPAGAKVFTCSWSDWFIEEADDWRADAWDIIRRRPDLTFQVLTKRADRIAAHLPPDWGSGWPNVWLGVSVENQDTANERVRLLARVPAQVRFLSCEPLLGPVSLAPWLWWETGQNYHGEPERGLYGDIHWVICGGESGPGARPMESVWAESLRDQCADAGVAFFMKQMAKKAPIPEGLLVRQFPGRTP